MTGYVGWDRAADSARGGGGAGREGGCIQIFLFGAGFLAWSGAWRSGTLAGRTAGCGQAVRRLQFISGG
jgi:hypothetical protein